MSSRPVSRTWSQKSPHNDTKQSRAWAAPKASASVLSTGFFLTEKVSPEFLPVLIAHLVEDIRNVGLHGPFVDDEAFRDFPVWQPLFQQFQHLAFAGRQVVPS